MKIYLYKYRINVVGEYRNIIISIVKIYSNNCQNSITASFSVSFLEKTSKLEETTF